MQPALYLQVSKLATEVGVPLYRRVGRQLELTAAGVELAAFAREARERSSRLVEELRTGHSHLPVTLAAGRRRSASRLVLLQREHAATIEAVRCGEAHLGVTPLGSRPVGIDAELLTAVPQVVVVPARHRLARKRVVRRPERVPPRPRRSRRPAGGAPPARRFTV